MSKLSNFLLATFLAILCFGFYFDQVAFAENSILTQEQSSWLSKRNNTILIRPERNYPPFVFSVQNGLSNVIQGLGVDYLELITKKIGAKVQYFEPTQLSNILSSFKEGKEGVAIALTKTAEREEYLYFTKSFISIPAVIVARKDSNLSQGDTSLADLSGKVVAVGKAHAVESYIKSSYPNIVLDSLPDDEVSLQKLLLGEVDAAVMDLASLSYYTNNQALSYVSVVGQANFNYNLSFAISKKNKELQNIFDTALGTVTPQEASALRDKWITLKDVSIVKSEPTSLFKNPIFVVVVSILIIFFILSTSVFLSFLKKIQTLLAQNLKFNKNKNEIESKLESLENAKAMIKKELEHIDELENNLKDTLD